MRTGTEAQKKAEERPRRLMLRCGKGEVEACVQDAKIAVTVRGQGGAPPYTRPINAGMQKTGLDEACAVACR